MGGGVKKYSGNFSAKKFCKFRGIFLTVLDNLSKSLVPSGPQQTKQNKQINQVKNNN